MSALHRGQTGPVEVKHIPSFIFHKGKDLGFAPRLAGSGTQIFNLTTILLLTKQTDTWLQILFVQGPF